ncbi:MAG: ATP-binding protein [Paracoccaceae bacterium]|jgi:serine/threonine-protein kinase RsbW
MPADEAGLRAKPQTDTIDMQAVAQFRMASDPHSVREGLRQALEGEPLTRLSVDDRNTAEIVLAEVLNNVVEHAYAAKAGSVFLFLSLGEGRLHCRIEDEGTAMPGNAPPAGNPPDPADLPEGGFGWHLIRTLSTDLCYERMGSVNRLSFSLPAEQSGR